MTRARLPLTAIGACLLALSVGAVCQMGSPPQACVLHYWECGESKASPSSQNNCACSEHLTELQMSKQAKHIEVERIDEHVLVSGSALIDVVVTKEGRVWCARVISGDPKAAVALIGAASKWRFKPYLKNGIPQQFCGQLRGKLIENRPYLELAVPAR